MGKYIQEPEAREGVSGLEMGESDANGTWFSKLGAQIRWSKEYLDNKKGAQGKTLGIPVFKSWAKKEPARVVIKAVTENLKFPTAAY